MMKYSDPFLCARLMKISVANYDEFASNYYEFYFIEI